MRFCSLDSGSTGNATIVEARSGASTSRVLIDCGFSLSELEARLARAGLAPTDIDGVFITHEHGDHVGCAMSLARRYRRPLWMSRGTWQAIGEPDLPGLVHWAEDGSMIAIGDLQLTAFAVPHDAREPLQLRCSDGARSVGVLTDAGSITAHRVAHPQGLDALLPECNHDQRAACRIKLSRIGAGTHRWAFRPPVERHCGHVARSVVASRHAAFGRSPLERAQHLGRAWPKKKPPEGGSFRSG